MILAKDIVSPLADRYDTISGKEKVIYQRGLDKRQKYVNEEEKRKMKTLKSPTIDPYLNVQETFYDSNNVFSRVNIKRFNEELSKKGSIASRGSKHLSQSIKSGLIAPKSVFSNKDTVKSVHSKRSS